MILLGEMRDLETISTALTAAETGHLVFGTLHTQSAPGTIDRIIDVFPAEQQEQVRIQLAGSLQGVVTQALLPTADGTGRVAALEILLPGRRRPEPDPPGEGRADLLRHADRHAARDADDGAVARRSRPARRRHAGRRRCALEPARSSSLGLLERAGFEDPSAASTVPSLRRRGGVAMVDCEQGDRRSDARQDAAEELEAPRQETHSPEPEEAPVEEPTSVEPVPAAEPEPGRSSSRSSTRSRTSPRRGRVAEEGDLALVPPQAEGAEARRDETADGKTEKPAKVRTKRSFAARAGPRSAPSVVVGLKIGASQLAAARVVNNGSAELVQVAREPSSTASSSAASCATPSALADALKAFFASTSCRKRNVRLGIANNRIGVRTFEIAGIDDPKQLDERDPLPRPGGAADPDRGGRARLPRALASASTRRAARCGASCSSSPTASSSTATSTPAARPGSELVGIDLEAFALLRALGEPRRGRGCGDDAARSSPSRSATTARPSPSPTAASASSRACSTGAAPLDVAVARALDMSAVARPSRQARALARRSAIVPEGFTAGAGRARAGGGPRAAPDVRARARLLAPVLPGPARLAGHRRDRAHRRHRAPRRASPRSSQRLIGVPVASAIRSCRVKLGKKVRRAASSSARSRSRSASGSRTRPMRAVNLLPRRGRAERERRSAWRRRRRASASPRSLAAALGVDDVSAAARSRDKQAELDGRCSAELAATPAARRSNGRAADARLQPRRTPARRALAALSRRVAWDRVLREVSLVLPDDVWLDDAWRRRRRPGRRAGAGRRGPPAPASRSTGSTYSHERRRAPALAARGRARPRERAAAVEHAREAQGPRRRLVHDHRRRPRGRPEEHDS